MAVYQGARQRPAFFPPRAPLADAPPIPRRRVRAARRARRRSDRTGVVVGGIVLAFLFAFFSLAQTVRVSATSYDLDALLVERQQLEAQEQAIRSDLGRLGREPAVRKMAIDAGLGQLAEPVVVRAR
jgi:hypothetical protein